METDRQTEMTVPAPLYQREENSAQTRGPRESAAGIL